MSKKIRVLDKQTADKIAAGEVIERPVSVVKELVENSLDAGSNSISVKIQDGGKKSIVVIDNGCGIEAEYVDLAFVRHATSKIYTEKDLFNIKTLGFRGEALPSIAAVSKVTMITRTRGAQSGVKLEIEDGQVKSSAPTGCSVGTTVVAKDIFYNMPARKKHLKKGSVEAALISDMLSRLALSNPNVKLKLVHNRTILDTPGSGKLIDVIAAVSGFEIAKNMLEIELKTPDVSVSGYIGKPELLRPNRNQQTIIVNGRYVRSDIISDALKKAYDTMIPSKYYPVAVLFIDVDNTLVDVNVHPAKLRVRFSNESEVYELILRSVKKALRSVNVVPEAKKLLAVGPVRSKNNQIGQKNQYNRSVQQRFSFDKHSCNAQKGVLFDQYRHFMQEKAVEKNNLTDAKNTNISETSSTYFSEAIAEDNISDSCFDSKQEGMEHFPEMWPIAQLLPTYILAQSREGLYIIDQHAAHERILYEKYIHKFDGQHDSQTLMMSVVLNLNFDEAQILERNIVLFQKMGFILEHFGDNTYLLRGVPVDFPAGEETQFFLEVLNNAGINKDVGEKSFDDIKKDTFFDDLAAALACKSAIKSGQKLSNIEMEMLIEEMRNLKNPYTCPHGRPTVINLSYDELEKRFKRK